MSKISYAGTGRLVLLRTFKERVRLTFLCSGFAAFMGFMLTEMDKWKPVGVIEHLIHGIGVEIFITFGLFSLLGVVWGLFAPSWLERFLQRGFQKVVAIFCVIGVGSILSVAFYLLIR
jgi:hypothetical protein